MPALSIPLMMTMTIPAMLPQPSTMPAMQTTSLTPPLYWSDFHCCLTLETQVEDEDFIGPDGQAIPLPEGFHVAPGTAVDVSRHVDTALTPPTTEDYSIIPVVTNMTQVESDMPPPHPWTGRSLWGSTSGQPLPAGLSWVPVDDAFVNASLQTHTLPATPALIMRLMLPQKIEDW
jgi:hypothetical protein